MSRKTNLRRLSVLVTAQTLHNLERLAAMDGSQSLNTPWTGCLRRTRHVITT